MASIKGLVSRGDLVVCVSGFTGSVTLDTLIVTEVGSEVIDGHPTIKYQVHVTYKGDAPSQEGFVWRATDLGDMIIKSEMENEAVQYSTVLKNIVLKTPAAALFEVPADFVESKNFMEIVMEGQ